MRQRANARIQHPKGGGGRELYLDSEVGGVARHAVKDRGHVAAALERLDLVCHVAPTNTSPSQAPSHRVRLASGTLNPVARGPAPRRGAASQQTPRIIQNAGNFSRLHTPRQDRPEDFAAGAAAARLSLPDGLPILRVLERLLRGLELRALVLDQPPQPPALLLRAAAIVPSHPQKKE